jgi:hypothetical protein
MTTDHVTATIQYIRRHPGCTMRSVWQHVLSRAGYRERESQRLIGRLVNGCAIHHDRARSGRAGGLFARTLTESLEGVGTVELIMTSRGWRYVAARGETWSPVVPAWDPHALHILYAAGAGGWSRADDHAMGGP